MAVSTSIKRLRPLPSIAVDLLGQLSIGSLEPGDLLGLLKDDPRLLDDVYQVAVLSELSEPMETPDFSSVLEQIGSTMLAEIAITVLIRSYLRNALSVSEDYRYWRYMLACAVCCEQVALRRQQDILLCYAAGFLHDIGRMALIAAYPNQYSNLLTLTDRMFAAHEPFDMLEYERLLFGLDHFETGMWVAGAWQLPQWLSSIVGKFDERASGDLAELVSTVRAGTRLAHSLGFGYLEAAPRMDIREILGHFPDADRTWKVLDSWEYAEENIRGKIRARLRSYSTE